MPPSTTLLRPGIGSGETFLDTHVAIASMAFVTLRSISDSQCLHSPPAVRTASPFTFRFMI